VVEFNARHFQQLGGSDMTPVRLALIATTAAGLMAIAAPAFAEVVATPDGQYFRLVPVRTPGPGAAPEMVNIIPQGATANVAPASNCRLTNFEDHEYQPEYVTVCGPQ
jgi:hypothetical protein